MRTVTTEEWRPATPEERATYFAGGGLPGIGDFRSTEDSFEVRDLMHDPTCTGCDHACAWRGLVIGAPYCQVCDDHGEAVHAGYGDVPCDCGGNHDD